MHDPRIGDFEINNHVVEYDLTFIRLVRNACGVADLGEGCAEVGGQGSAAVMTWSPAQTPKPPSPG
jgi:hypothetical protein